MSEKIIEHSSRSMYENDMVKYSIIVNRRRAFPEVRDGLKPVQRRVIFAAYKDGLTSPGRKDKSASLVGTTMKYYHPHGDCIDGETIITDLAGNSYKIKDLYLNNVKSIEILAIDEKSGKVVPAKAHSFRIGQYTNKIYHIQLSNGNEILVTGNHPFMLPNCGWIKAENIKPYMRLMSKPIRTNRRPSIDNELIQNIVHDYYNGPLIKGNERHHIDGNYMNNYSNNIISLPVSEHAKIHGNSSTALNGLEKGRNEMFSEDGKFRFETERKNSLLMSEFNKDQGIRRFKIIINKMKESGMEITEENYESFRDKVYNLPIISRLIARHPECGSTFDELVNYEPESISNLYNNKMDNVICPISFEQQNDEIYSLKVKNIPPFVINKIEYMIDNNLSYDVETYKSICGLTSLSDQEIQYYLNSFTIEYPFVTNVVIEEVDNVPMYDFTVDRYANMIIPVGSTVNTPMEAFNGKLTSTICIHNSSIYETIVNLVNWFKTKMPIFYGKGGWGNVAGDGASASRYTECALSNFGYDVFIDELSQSNNIVDWNQTYKRNNDREPEFLPAKVPILLVNGTFGIGVGMAVNVPSHNLIEVIEVTRLLMKNPKADFVLIPDLCQPCHIIDTDWKSIAETGRGSFKVRGNINTETDKKGNYILRITSLPDMVTTTSIYDKILKMVEDKQLPMIKDIFKAIDVKTELPDIIIHLKPGSDPNYVKQVLYAKTEIQKSFSVNFEAVSVNGIDTQRYSYRDYLLTFIDQRMNVKFRLYCNKLQQVMTRHHQVDAFVKVLESGKIDTIINMIRKHKGTDDIVIVEWIIKNIKLTDIQAKFIINTNLSRLSMGHLNGYKSERKDLEDKIKKYQAAVTDDGSIIKKEIDLELSEIQKKYGTPRLCDVVSTASENEIPKGTFKIVITERNYIRKIPDVDKINIVRKDNPKFILKVDNAENLLIFDNKGKVFNLPVSKVPITDKSSPGTDIRILIRNLTSDIISVFYEPIFQKIAQSGNKHYLTVLTKSNTVKKLDIDDFLNVNPSGLMYSKVRDDDEVVGIALAQAKLDVVMCSGKNALRTTMKEIPLFKRNASGSKAMDTTEDINGLSVIYPDTSDIVVVTKNGKFNRFNITMLPAYARARKGVQTIKLDNNDEIFNIFGVNESDKIRLVTSEGIEEVAVSDIKVKSRIAAGTKMMQSKGIIVRADVVR